MFTFLLDQIRHLLNFLNPWRAQSVESSGDILLLEPREPYYSLPGDTLYHNEKYQCHIKRTRKSTPERKSSISAESDTTGRERAASSDSNTVRSLLGAGDSFWDAEPMFSESTSSVGVECAQVPFPSGPLESLTRLP